MSAREPSGAAGQLRQTASTALPTHDPASVLPQGAPEPPGCLHAPPWLAPSTAEAGGTVVTVRRALRLPSVAESAELLGGGWAPLLGRLGVWVDEGGDSSARWWTGALERVRRDRSRADADEHSGRRVWWSRVAAGGASE